MSAMERTIKFLEARRDLLKSQGARETALELNEAIYDLRRAVERDAGRDGCRTCHKTWAECSC